MDLKNYNAHPNWADWTGVWVLGLAITGIQSSQQSQPHNNFQLRAKKDFGPLAELGTQKFHYQLLRCGVRMDIYSMCTL